MHFNLKHANAYPFNTFQMKSQQIVGAAHDYTNRALLSVISVFSSLEWSGNLKTPAKQANPFTVQ